MASGRTACSSSACWGRRRYDQGRALHRRGKLIWDAVGTEFGSRHEWYEINYSGNQEQMRLDMARFSGGRGIIDECEALVDQCLAEYDLDGWTDGIWAGPDRAGDER